MENTNHTSFNLEGRESSRQVDMTNSSGLRIVRDLTMALARDSSSVHSNEENNPVDSIDLNEEVRRFEVSLIRSALARTGGHQTRAARLLGIKLTTLNDKIRRYGIDPRDVEIRPISKSEMLALMSLPPAKIG